MTEEQKQIIKFNISLLKQQMKLEGTMFAFLINKEDVDNSKLCFIDKKAYLATGELEGIAVSLAELNSGLFE